MAIKSVDASSSIELLRDPRQIQASAGKTQPPATRTGDPPATAPDTANAEPNAKDPTSAHDPLVQAPQEPSIRFHVDQDTGKTVVSFVDPDGEVVRQVPSNEALELAKALGKMQGMFVDLKV